MEAHYQKSFRYTAFDHFGTLSTGAVTASSREAAMELLHRQGLTPIEAEIAVSQRSMLSKLFDASGGPTRRELELMTRQLAVLGQANVPIDDALRIIRDEEGSRRVRPLLSDLLDRLLEGARFSTALAAHPSVFPEDYRTIVHAGETAGDWAGALSELAALLRKREEMTGKTMSALIYPALLVAVGIVSLAVIIGVLVPNVAPIFSSNGRPPPGLFAILLALEDNGSRIGLTAIVLLLGAAGGAVLLRRSPSGMRTWDRMLLGVPVIGEISLQQSMARFSRTMAALLRAGAPMLAAVDASSQTVRNRHLRVSLEQVLSELREGRSLSRALSRVAPMPRIAISMAAVGEETAKLPVMLSYVAEWLESQADRRIERLTTLLTPVLTLTIATLVGGLMFSVMTAILSINELASQ